MILDQVDQEHQVSRGLGDPIPEKLAGVVQKYWQYKPKKLSVVKSLNDKFLIPSNCGEICDPSLNREIFCSKNIVPWVKRTNNKTSRAPNVSRQSHSRPYKTFGVYFKD